MEQLVVLILVAFWVYLWIRIVGKTGNNQWLGLLMVVPVVNLGLVVWLAFSEWPLEKRGASNATNDDGSMIP